jgi:hypothetical protein
MDAPVHGICPCCRRPLEAALSAPELCFVALPPNSSVARPLLELLAATWPRPVAAAVLVEQIYAARPNGEPEYAMKSVQVAIVYLRRRLKPLGWTITDGRRGSYRLERVP